jgi:AcrR family transcriptional regulator
MVSSAVYRYVPSRDALLTALIIEAYDALGEATEEAETQVDRSDIVGRWRAIGSGAREWALEHPHDWALIFGSPVIGYAAPADTIPAATRIPSLLRDAQEAGVRLPDGAVDAQLRRTIGPVADFFGDAVPPETTVRGLMAWTWLTGSISHQLFGHRHNVVDDAAVFFAAELDRMADFLGLGRRER